MRNPITLLTTFVALMLFISPASAWPVPDGDEQDHAAASHEGDEADHGDEGDHAGGDTSHGGDDGHGDAGHGEAHGGGHHDPYDKAAANAGSTQGTMFELRADLALATLVVFFLLLAVLYKFAWGPIAEALDRREQGVANQLEEARRNQEQTQSLLAEHEAKLAAASEEVREILENARRDAEVQKTNIIAEAEQAAAAEKDRAVREITAAKHSALQELAETSVDQAIGLAGQIVGKQLNKDDHQKLIKDAINQFPSKV